jgi:hypothetical protein
MNGTSWTVLYARWPPRYNHGSVVYGDKMWVMGGRSPYGWPYTYYNDVWYSSDGVNWTSATINAPWSPRLPHAVVVFNGAMWVLGGETKDDWAAWDAWCSTDGANWTLVSGATPWFGYAGVRGCVAGGKMWVMGGSDSYTWSSTFDMWSSRDGVNWQFAGYLPTPRESFGLVVHNGRMWILGGLWHQSPNSYYLNDVWYSDLPTDVLRWHRYP